MSEKKWGVPSTLIPFSVGVALRNEATTVRRLIASIAKQELQPECIYCCLNGCTDATEQILLNLQDEHPHIRLLYSEPGKSQAVRTIFDTAKSNVLIMLDADVNLQPGAFEYLLDCYHGDSTAMLVAGAYQLISQSKHWALHSYEAKKRAAPKLPSTVSGGLYLLDMARMRVCATRLEVPLMPSTVVNDDEYLGLLALSAGGLRHERRAIVHLRGFANLYELWNRKRRSARGARQILREYPQLLQWSPHRENKQWFDPEWAWPIKIIHVLAHFCAAIEPRIVSSLDWIPYRVKDDVCESEFQ